MDRIDEKILQELQDDGRISHTELGRRIGLSASAAQRRVQELERRNIITGYKALIDPAAIGNTFTAYIGVGLNNHTRHTQLSFERAISSAREVRECHNVAGTIEYLLRVEVANLAAYKSFHTDVLGALPQVSSIITYTVLSSPKDERG